MAEESGVKPTQSDYKVVLVSMLEGASMSLCLCVRVPLSVYVCAPISLSGLHRVLISSYNKHIQVISG